MRVKAERESIISERRKKKETDLILTQESSDSRK